jgi:short-subunit dehydrogenase
MKLVLPQMRKQQSGLIINITSIAGYMGLYRSLYSASRTGLITEALRMEVKSFGFILLTSLLAILLLTLQRYRSSCSKISL